MLLGEENIYKEEKKKEKIETGKKGQGGRKKRGKEVRGDEEYCVCVSLGSSLHSQEGGTEERGELESVFSSN